ncbi:GDSL esterase/lipase EXL1-like [Lycium barbarum]|uniref:GDSL esterase/lipase EXL1-like n=1 Tax=Lycium barbarum TaxID=112863 RepID=UPI00293F527C|nr:GDSL esterase/lipase EXL1-like [Lycium barbarum]
MKFLLFKIYSFLVLSISFCYAIRIPPNKSIPAVIVFGDSIVDTGNNNGLKTIFKVNYPPYGQNFMGGIPTGRFSDGKVPSDFLVEELGIKDLLPAYLDPTLQAEDLITGVNFASGGAGYDPLTSEIAKVISLSRQLALFKEYIVKLKEIVGEDRKNEILANSLFILVTGSNDITNTYFSTPLRKSYYNISSYADLLVNSASSFVQDLYELGARRIGVLSIPPIGCLPSQRTLEGGEERECVDYLNQAAQLFNSKLAADLNSLGNRLPNSRLVYVDIYNLTLDVIYNPQKYGFKIADKGCCGTGKIEVAEICTFTCSSDSDYVFWDSFHLTEKAYRLLAHQILFSSFKICTFLVLSSIFYALLLCNVQAIINIPRNKSIPAVIVFGDSIVDTGNNNGLKTVAKVNYPPYGKDFMGGKPTGRFSNGKVPPDLIVEELGIKELLPAYLDPTLQAEDLITGVNFASGGAGYDPLTSEIANVISLSGQLEMFKEYIVTLKEIVGEDRKNEILANSFFILVIGSNDITNTYFSTPLRISYYDVSSYADFLVNYASSFVQDLYRLGARRIGVLGIPPIGCLPSQRTLKGGEERKCVDYLNQAAQLFNSKLATDLSSLGNKFPDSRLVYVDIYNLLLDVINDPQKFGFRIADKGCCGTGKIEVAEICTVTCSSDTDYVFWDSFHPTEKAYRLSVHQILVQHLSSFF